MTPSSPGPFLPCFEAIPPISLDRWGVPLVFRRHCALWEGTARRIDTAGHCIDTDRVRVEIAIEDDRYVQTNTVRIDTPQQIVACYHGQFIDSRLVFPLTDEVVTLAGERATAFSGIAWAISDHVLVYSGSRSLRGVRTHYNEIITLVSDDHRVRTTQLYEDGVYRHVTMIEEWRQPRP
ncbi:hypothetical protein [Cyanobium sp. Morenito 9A2]|uniref:hypothetical protein n=1 Tax=Cyanobium sp. Morenito 9A2 TaxID=2823718 RepID=UPI0020CDAC40|nr:hypothetical protein [Cyanobium sp. Morenito 9A2]MCP9848364.1 hypothetical protein [Cyanobium sp. Morenito 9A2]